MYVWVSLVANQQANVCCQVHQSTLGEGEL